MITFEDRDAALYAVYLGNILSEAKFSDPVTIKVVTELRDKLMGSIGDNDNKNKNS